jgi:single-strand DNA-binding protein
MAGINKVILVGNLGKDPEIQTLESGAKKASFSLATSESYKNKEGVRVDQTEWHNIVLWRGLAEIAEKFLKKGNTVYIEGKIRTRSWDDKEGNKRYTTEIIGDNLTMLGGKPSSQSNESGETPQYSSNANSIPEQSDDLPF